MLSYAAVNRLLIPVMSLTMIDSFAHKGGRQQPASRMCHRGADPHHLPRLVPRVTLVSQFATMTLVKVKWLHVDQGVEARRAPSTIDIQARTQQTCVQSTVNAQVEWWVGEQFRSAVVRYYE